MIAVRVAALVAAAALAAVAATPASSTGTSLRWVVKNCHASNGWCGWQDTVDCENHGRWPDSSGPFYFGVQFAYSTMTSAQRATGVVVTAWPPTQIVNAIWTRDEARRRGYPDPWPNCPNP